MKFRSRQNWLCVLLTLLAAFTGAAAKTRRARLPPRAIPTQILLRIIRAEDERRWDDQLRGLLNDKDARVRKRSALAAGRIGDERAVPALVDLLRGQDEPDMRQMAAFALGEIESPMGAKVLIVLLEDTREQRIVRERAIEALGKIGAAVLNNATASGAQPIKRPEDASIAEIRTAITEALKFEAGRRSLPDRESILLGLTAALRTKPDGVGPIIVRFLGHTDARIRADAFNALARLRLKDGNVEAREMLVKDPDPIVRANAARVLGATEDKQAFDALLDRALHDNDLRVRVSAIRALGSLKEERAAKPLLARGTILLRQVRSKKLDRPSELNELLEIATAIGSALRNSESDEALTFLRGLPQVKAIAPEVNIALARISPKKYLNEDRAHLLKSLTLSALRWRVLSSLMQGYRELANAQLSADEKHRTEEAIAYDVCIKLPKDGCESAEYALPDGLRAYAAFKPTDLAEVLRQQFKITWYSWGPVSRPLPAPKGIYAVPSYTGYNMPADVIIRATAAELLGELAPTPASTMVLVDALSIAFYDEMNDAALAILDALGRQQTKEANDAIKTALDSSDHLIRRKAVALLKANGAGDFSNRIGTVKTRNTEADYRRAIGRIGKHVTTTVVTSKGSFTIEFLPEDAPLTVDNFIQLARKGFFDGQTIPRVVSNFVIQAGDPRGDTNGGPGYQIRCEINEVPYQRGAVGMALSGKDTGGSQWFVTHSPQPHLDGGYTVFGRVIRGMDVVDNIARGDVIRRVIVNER